MMWLPIAGLDRHTPMIGLHALSAEARVGALTHRDRPIEEAIYRPISGVHTREG